MNTGDIQGKERFRLCVPRCFPTRIARRDVCAAPQGDGTAARVDGCVGIELCIASPVSITVSPERDTAAIGRDTLAAANGNIASSFEQHVASGRRGSDIAIEGDRRCRSERDSTDSAQVRSIDRQSLGVIKTQCADVTCLYVGDIVVSRCEGDSRFGRSTVRRTQYQCVGVNCPPRRWARLRNGCPSQ